MRVRPAAVAGQFYPADPVALAASVNALLATAPAGGRRPTAVIAPHAGYRYSGAVAGAAYARLAASRGEVRRVVVLGPAHHVRLRGMAVPQVDAFATPLGPVPVDLEARRTALDLPAVVLSDRPHAPEHAIETQLPFLLHALGPEITLLPVLVGATPPEAVAELLAALLTGPQTVAVLSTDLSHYLDRNRARLRDTHTAAAILARDAAAIRPADACGHHPLCGASVLRRRPDAGHRAAAAGDLRRHGRRPGAGRRLRRVRADRLTTTEQAGARGSCTGVVMPHRPGTAGMITAAEEVMRCWSRSGPSQCGSPRRSGSGSPAWPAPPRWTWSMRSAPDG